MRLLHQRCKRRVSMQTSHQRTRQQASCLNVCRPVVPRNETAIAVIIAKTQEFVLLFWCHFGHHKCQGPSDIGVGRGITGGMEMALLFLWGRCSVPQLYVRTLTEMHTLHFPCHAATMLLDIVHQLPDGWCSLFGNGDTKDIAEYRSKIAVSGIYICYGLPSTFRRTQ